MRAVHTGSTTVVAARVRVADRFWTRLRGLIGGPALQPGEGLLIDPCDGVHTFFMGYPIDLLFLDDESRVVAALHGMKPWRVTRRYHARRVLELPGGTLAGLNAEVTVGDEVAIG